MNGMESVRDLLDGANIGSLVHADAMRWHPPAEPPPADQEEPNL